MENNQQQTPLQAQPAPQMPTPQTGGIHPMMTTSLPPLASGADVYYRQFYGGPDLRRRRYLPVSL